jgi:hypothetical protein
MKRFLDLNLYVIVVALTSTIFCCKKELPYKSNAEIIGWDAKTCPCCGGAEIVIDSVQTPNGNPYFLTRSLPASFSLGENPKFPIPVKIDWKIDTLHCFGNYVDILRIARR